METIMDVDNGLAAPCERIPKLKRKRSSEHLTLRKTAKSKVFQQDLQHDVCDVNMNISVSLNLLLPIEIECNELIRCDLILFIRFRTIYRKWCHRSVWSGKGAGCCHSSACLEKSPINLRSLGTATIHLKGAPLEVQHLINQCDTMQLQMDLTGSQFKWTKEIPSRWSEATVRKWRLEKRMKFSDVWKNSSMNQMHSAFKLGQVNSACNPITWKATAWIHCNARDWKRNWMAMSATRIAHTAI